MTHEGVYPEAGTPPLTDEHFLDRYGLGPDEINMEVSFMGYTGTVKAMLTDERCPVGGMIHEAYKEEGFAGVEDQFNRLTDMSRGKFVVQISEVTRNYHGGSIDKDAVLARAPQEDRQAFLA